MDGAAAGCQQRRGVKLAIALGAALACAAVAGHAAHPFDGRWEVTITCPNAADGARGYTLRFAARVQDGVFAGAYRGSTTAEGSLDLNGPIALDGTARLAARGLTGDPRMAAGRVAQQTPYAYTLETRFQGDAGTGRRIETRPCEASFRRG